MQQCIEYIESNLKGEIDLDHLSRLAFLSRRYFLTMFDAITGMSINEYVRKRRMSLAAYDLIEKNRRVTDVAYEYGYSSPEAFSRAFKSIHGVSPALAGKEGNFIKLFMPISFHIEIKGDVFMKYRVEESDKFRVFGKAISTSCLDGSNFKEIPEFWSRVFQDGQFKAMAEQCDSGSKSFGVCMPMKNETEFDYVIGFSGEKDSYTDFETFEIPKAKWAIFECLGPMPEAIQSVWKRIFKEGLPSVEYEIDETIPQLEYYSEGDTSSQNYYSEVWIPVKE